MSKGLLVFLLGISTLIMYPFQVHGEESVNEKRGLLSESITQLFKKTEIVTEEVNSTLNNTLPVDEIEEITTIVEPVVGIVKEVEDKTISIVEQVITEVPSTTDSIVSDVISIVDETVETVPDIPLVTPVLTEVSDSVKKVTDKAQGTIEHSTESVLVIIDKKDVLIPEEKKSKSTGRLEKVEEPVNNDTDLRAEESKIPQNLTIPTALPEISVLAVKESPEQNQPTVEEKIAIVEKESFVETSHFVQEKSIKGKVNSKEVKSSTNKSATSLPAIPDKQKNKKMVIPILTTSASSPNSSSQTVIVQGGDTLFALVPSQEPMKELIRKKWYHKNHYAVIQWIHTPLRKPPEFTPFYT